MFCTNCGKKISDDSKYCPNCGRTQTPTNARTGKSKNGKSIAIAVLATVLVCALIVLLLLATGVLNRPSEIVEKIARDDSTQGETILSELHFCSGTISAGNRNCFAIKEDRTVVAIGENDHGECDVSDWTDIIAVSGGFGHTLGLRSDGTVVAAGENEYGECDVSGWTDIIAVSAGYDFSLGLKKDGTVVSVGINDEYTNIDVFDWTDIVAIDNDFERAYGLKSDGTIIVSGVDFYQYNNRNEWSGLTAFDADFASGIIGLKKDGTAVAKGDYGDYDVSGWSDIVSVQAAGTMLFGLKKDGTVVCDIAPDSGECFDDEHLMELRTWKNIVSISAGCYGDDVYIIGLKNDGTVAYIGWEENDKRVVESWNHIKR